MTPDTINTTPDTIENAPAETAPVIMEDPAEAVRRYIAAHPLPLPKKNREKRRAEKHATRKKGRKSRARGWYTAARMAEWRAELAATRAELAAREDLRHVHFSDRNRKIGEAWSVSLMPFLTCPAFVRHTCGRYCYAARMAALLPSVRRAWMINTALVLDFPGIFWTETEARYQAAGILGHAWRWHVGGEIISADYARNMIRLAERYPATIAWTYSKRPEWINQAITENGRVPASLAVILSAEKGITPENPHGLPLSYVMESETVAAIVDKLRPRRVTICPGDCSSCHACENARPGDVIIFPKH